MKKGPELSVTGGLRSPDLGEVAMDPPDVHFEVLPTTDERLQAVVRALEAVFGGGDVILCSFQSTRKRYVEPSYRPDLEGDQTLKCLLQAESVRAAVPDLQIPFPLDRLPPYDLYSGFEFEGAVTRLLLMGGAYTNSKCSEEDARKLSCAFVDALVDRNRLHVSVYYIKGAWTDWFYDVAWDATFIALNHASGRWTLFCVTDTD